MTMRTAMRCTAGAGFLLGFANLALANGSAPLIPLLPEHLFGAALDIWPLAVLIALPASVLAAFIERPFITRAGVARCTLWYSLQANLLSMLFGYLLLVPVALITAGLVPFFYLLWMLFAVLFTIAIESFYLNKVAAPPGRKLTTGPIAWGNLLSCLTILLVQFVVEALRYECPFLVRLLLPYRELLLWLGAAGSVVIFLVSFLLPGRRALAPAPATPAPRQAVRSQPLPPAERVLH